MRANFLGLDSPSRYSLYGPYLRTVGLSPSDQSRRLMGFPLPSTAYSPSLGARSPCEGVVLLALLPALQRRSDTEFSPAAMPSSGGSSRILFPTLHFPPVEKSVLFLALSARHCCRCRIIAVTLHCAVSSLFHTCSAANGEPYFCNIISLH